MTRAGKEESQMPLYVVEREFPDGLAPETGMTSAQALEEDLDRNVQLGVTWLHSYVSEDRRRTFCVYGGPSPEAIRLAADRSRLPIERITQVRVLDPYFYPTEARRAK
jgi:hypothetical protein